MTAKWSKPVTVNSPWLGKITVSDPFHALTLLMDTWPAMSGPHFLRARIACSAALQGRADVEDARKLFERAAAEAEAYVKATRASATVRHGTGAPLQ